MADLFDDLGRKISKTAEEVTKKTTEVVEKQRLKSHVYSLERGIQNQYQEIGRSIFQKYQAGEELEQQYQEICEEIEQKKHIIEKYEKEIAKISGMTICENCGTSVARKDIFCKRCGTQVQD